MEILRWEESGNIQVRSCPLLATIVYIMLVHIFQEALDCLMDIIPDMSKKIDPAFEVSAKLINMHCRVTEFVCVSNTTLVINDDCL